MQIESIEIKNYRVFHNTKMDSLSRLVVLIGANGTGKSTLFDVFAFLKDALQMNVGKAVAKRGGWKELTSRNFSHEPIEFTFQFRLDITGHERLVSYVLKIEQDEKGHPVVAREILRYKRSSYGAPFHFLDFAYGKGYAITNEEDFSKADKELNRETQALDEPDILAIKGLGQFERFKAARSFRSMVENWHISDFHINYARNSNEEGYAEHLSTSGDNMAQVAQYLFNYHPDKFQQVLSAMEQRVPGVNRVEAKPLEDGRLALRFGDRNFQDPFISRFVSDGTIKMFAYLLLLYDPKPFPILAIEEPENQLYPEFLRELAEEFRTYAVRGGQVFVSTHSPDFLNALKLEEIYCLRKKDGFTTIAKSSDDETLRSLIEEGDLPGYLWKQGLFEGLVK